MAIITVMSSLNVGSSPAAGCYYNGVPYSPNAPGLFQMGQWSQGGNYYYGVAGVVSNSNPPNPLTSPTSIPEQHVAMLMGPVDVRYSGTGTPAWAYAGWAIGHHQYNNTIMNSPTVVAEFARYSMSPVLVTAGLAPSSNWYKVQLSFGSGLTWHYDAWQYLAGNWALLGDGIDFTTSPTEQNVFGEASDPGNGNNQTDRCRLLSAAGANNGLASLQLWVDNVVWQNWEPANGRYACGIAVNPYRPSPASLAGSEPCKGDGTFWSRKYTDFAPGGPQ